MALAILDGNQTATNLSTILTSGAHITAHTVVSLGTQAKTDILSAVSSGIAISGTVTVGNSVNINSLPSIRINPNYDGQSGNNGPVVEADSNVGSDPRYMVVAGGFDGINSEYRALTFTTGGLAIAGTVTASLAISSTSITKGSFTSLTSATLVPANTARKMATVYNLGAGQLFVSAGATATTLGGGFMVALSSGDFYECDYTTTTLSAIFATAGTASWVSH